MTTGIPAHGDRIRIAKGTPVYDQGGWPFEAVPAGRATTGTVETIRDMAEGTAWQAFITEDERERLWNASIAAGRTTRWPWYETWHHGIPVFDEVRNRILAMHGGDLRFVSWGARMAHIGDVEIVPAAPAKERALGLRDEMVPGSVWRTTRPIRLMGCVWRGYLDNEKYRIGYDGPPPGTVDGEPDMIRIAILDLDADTTFTVRNAKQKALGQGNGLGIPVEIEGAGARWRIEPEQGMHNPHSWNGHFLPLKQIEGAVERVTAAEARVFVLKDIETGLLFAGFTHDWAGKTEHLRMVETYTSARKYRDERSAKASICAWTGHVPRDAGADRPEWVGWDGIMDLPKTWRLVPIDVATRIEGEPIDLGDWYATLG